MDLPTQNAKYIQLLNQSNKILEQNISILESSIKTMDESLNRVARDSAALQRAVIDFLKAKEVIQTEEDLRLLQKLHMQHISQLDQEIAESRAKRKKEQT